MIVYDTADHISAYRVRTDAVTGVTPRTNVANRDATYTVTFHNYPAGQNLWRRITPVLQVDEDPGDVVLDRLNVYQLTFVPLRVRMLDELGVAIRNTQFTVTFGVAQPAQLTTDYDGELLIQIVNGDYATRIDLADFHESGVGSAIVTGSGTHRPFVDV